MKVCGFSLWRDFLTVKRGASLSPSFWELSLGSQRRMSRRFFSMQPLTRTVLFPTLSYKHEMTDTEWLNPRWSFIYLQGGLPYAHREQECSRNPGALSVCPPRHVTHRHHRVCPTPWENQRPPSIPVDAGSGFRSTAHRLTWVEAVSASRLSAALVNPAFPRALSPETSALLGAFFHTHFQVWWLKDKANVANLSGVFTISKHRAGGHCRRTNNLTKDRQTGSMGVCGW